MRVLLVNKFLHPVGGSETVFFNEWRWLEEAGHEVIPFGMTHPRNVDSPYHLFWTPTISYDQPTPAQLLSLIWSAPAARQISRLIAHTRPDVAHLHNVYHQLSPSIIAVLRRAGIPILLTLHDYKLICPNYRLYTRQQPCTRCVGSHPWHALRHRCLNASLPASGLAALETALHHALRAYVAVDRFIAPSRFMKEMMTRGGWAATRITVLPHAIEPPRPAPTPRTDPTILFAGRLVAEKGIELLLAAAARLPHIPFRLAGSGPLRRRADDTPANVTWLGQRTPDELAAAYAAARAVVIPSRWYEVFGMSALEAMSHGVPVVASDIGGLPEVVTHEETGLLVPPDDLAALVAAISRLWHDPPMAARLGEAARQRVRQRHAPAAHMAALLALFAQARTPQEQPA